jgi:hypothetical protein
MTQSAKLASLGTNNGNSVLVSGTAVASTSGTSIDFTGIPAWAKRITVIFNGVSTTGTANHMVQLGSGSVTTTGYVSGIAVATSTWVGSIISGTTGFQTYNVAAASDNAYGTLVLTLVGSNTWIASSSTYSTGVRMSFGNGGITLSGVLDRVRITTSTGTDTFDAGTINILYE